MKSEKNTEKTTLHPRNLHRFGYNFELLSQNNPELGKFVFINKHDIETIEFSEPEAVKQLNKALLQTDYGIENWDIPKNYLCPPIPGRADYIHYIADLLALSNKGKIPEGENVVGLDIGVGSNCIYPIIGDTTYGWNFVGTDTDLIAIENCSKIIEANPKLIDAISLQQQTEARFIFKNIITPEDRFTFTICNPPFHNSAEEAQKSATRKINNLNPNGQKTDKPILNFGGQNAELWCEGGELAFIKQMIYESTKYSMQCLWFTSLISKHSNLNTIYKTLNHVAARYKTIEMAQGQKTSRFVAWTFLTEEQQENWKFDDN